MIFDPHTLYGPVFHKCSECGWQLVSMGWQGSDCPRCCGLLNDEENQISQETEKDLAP